MHCKSTTILAFTSLAFQDRAILIAGSTSIWIYTPQPLSLALSVRIAAGLLCLLGVEGGYIKIHWICTLGFEQVKASVIWLTYFDDSWLMFCYFEARAWKRHLLSWPVHCQLQCRRKISCGETCTDLSCLGLSPTQHFSHPPHWPIRSVCASRRVAPGTVLVLLAPVPPFCKKQVL